jgi:hypothetical protein
MLVTGDYSIIPCFALLEPHVSPFTLMHHFLNYNLSQKCETDMQ